MHTALKGAYAHLPELVVLLCAEIVVGAHGHRVVYLKEAIELYRHISLNIDLYKAEATEIERLIDKLSVNLDCISHLVIIGKASVGAVAVGFPVARVEALKIFKRYLALATQFKAREAKGQVFCLVKFAIKGDYVALFLEIEHRNRALV